MITSIEQFISEYNSTSNKLVYLENNTFSINVLDYYADNYTKVFWRIISELHALTESFIYKHANSIKWHGLILNHKTKLTYKLLEDNIYRFNLYYIGTYNTSEKNRAIYNEIIQNYKEKYEIDKLCYKINEKECSGIQLIKMFG